MNYDFTNPYALNKDECEWLTLFCKKHRVDDALEFGPGNSTLAMIDGGVELVHCMEHDAERAGAFRNGLGKFSEIVNVHVYQHDQYPVVVSDLPDDYWYDLAVIDGPPGSSVTPARLNAALFCYSRSNILLFHDSKRDAQTIAVMVDMGMVVKDVFDSERGMAVLTRI